MYDDFWTGYNSGNGLSVNTPQSSEEVRKIKTEMNTRPMTPFNAGVLGTYDKSKIINCFAF